MMMPDDPAAATTTTRRRTRARRRSRDRTSSSLSLVRSASVPPSSCRPTTTASTDTTASCATTRQTCSSSSSSAAVRWLVVAACGMAALSGSGWKYCPQVAEAFRAVPGLADRHRHHQRPRQERQSCRCFADGNTVKRTAGGRRTSRIRRDGALFLDRSGVMMGCSGRSGWVHHHERCRRGRISSTGDTVLWARNDADHRPPDEEGYYDDGSSSSGGRPRLGPAALTALPPIRGLLPADEFERRRAVDATVRNVRRHLPRLLSVPVTYENGAADAYTSDTTLVIGETDNDDSNNSSSRGNGTTTNQVCSSLQELIDISQAVVTFVNAASQTQRFVDAALGGGAGGEGGGRSGSQRDGGAVVSSLLPRVDCRIVLDPNGTAPLDAFRVDWTLRWNAPPMAGIIGDAGEGEAEGNERLGAETSALLLQGTSKLLLSAEGKVRQHRIRTVKLNGRWLDATAVGGFLSNLRGTVMNFQQSPFYGFLSSAALGAGDRGSTGRRASSVPGDDDDDDDDDDPSRVSTSPSSSAPLNPFAPFLNQVRDELFQQITKTLLGRPDTNSADSTTDEPVLLAPVYIITNQEDLPNIDASKRDLLQDDTTGLWLLLDNDDGTAAAADRLRLPSRTVFPLPGTSDWSRYASVHERVVGFVNRTIPVLSGENVPSSAVPALETIFSTDCQYLVYDTVVPAPRGAPVNRTDLTPTLSLLSGSRKVARLYGAMASWRNLFSGSTWAVKGVDVLDWRAGTPSRVRVRYTSKLVVPSPPGLALTATATEVKVTGSDVYSIDARGRVVRVLQEELRINDGSLRNGQMFTKNLCAAIETGSSLGDDLLTAGIARLVPGGDKVTASAGQVAGELATSSSRSAFSDAAALTAFRIMESLARDVPMSLPVNVQSSSPRSRLPASQYVSEDIRLLGYFNETLLKGRSAYEASWNLAVTSYEAALRTNRIEAAFKDKPVITAKVEWTSDCCVRLTCDLRLVIKPILGLPVPPLPDAVPFPVRVQIVSDYVLDPETGRIAAHRLVETRLNDQLAPGDVVARWIRQLATVDTSGRANSGAADVERPLTPQNFVETSLWQWLLRFGSN